MSDTNFITMTCPNCRQQVRVKPELAGKAIRCPRASCGAQFRVPPAAKSVTAAHAVLPAAALDDELDEDRPRRRRWRRSDRGLSGLEYFLFGAAFLFVPCVNVIVSSVLYYVWRGSQPKRASQINFLGFAIFGCHILIWLLTFVGSEGRKARLADHQEARNRRSQAVQVPPPAVPDNCLFRPTFQTIYGDTTAGTAFAVQLPGQSRMIVVTALHLLGPDGGLQGEIQPRDVGRGVKSVVLQDLFDERREVDIGAEALIIPDAAPLGRPSKAGDIIAFWAPKEAKLRPLQLASRAPLEGERVWLAASLEGGAPATQRLHGATVAGLGPFGDYVYEFDNPQLGLRATSGAPVLNSAGEVVAINLGGGSNFGKVFGSGNHVDRFRPFLEAAAKASSQP